MFNVTRHATCPCHSWLVKDLFNVTCHATCPCHIYIKQPHATIEVSNLNVTITCHKELYQSSSHHIFLPWCLIFIRYQGWSWLWWPTMPDLPQIFLIRIHIDIGNKYFYCNNNTLYTLHWRRHWYSEYREDDKYSHRQYNTLPPWQNLSFPLKL